MSDGVKKPEKKTLVKKAAKPIKGFNEMDEIKPEQTAPKAPEKSQPISKYDI